MAPCSLPFLNQMIPLLKYWIQNFPSMLNKVLNWYSFHGTVLPEECLSVYTGFCFLQNKKFHKRGCVEKFPGNARFIRGYTFVNLNGFQALKYLISIRIF